MKRHKHLFDDITSFENLLRAAEKAQKGKRFTPATAQFNHNLENELLQLQEELQTQTYRLRRYKEFYINGPKPRMISTAPYRDHVVHHALCNVIEPIFERMFIYDSYACRKGKGTHAGVDRLTRFMQTNDYALKCDIKKYFPSIDHEILKGLIRRKIGCARTLWLIDLIIDGSNPQEEVSDCFPGDDLLTPAQRRKGVPIGHQTSQFFANIYLNPFDHFVKEELGCRYYIRYADDFVVLGDDKGWLWEVRAAMDEYLQTRLRLHLHPKKQWVLPVTNGVDFLGYRVFPTHRRLRRSSGWRFARRLKRMQEQYRKGTIDLVKVRQQIASWLGHAAHADTYGLRSALLGSAVFSRG
jgi:retron-type reverse transcriptase